jgi:hypothetical protein
MNPNGDSVGVPRVLWRVTGVGFSTNGNDHVHEGKCRGVRQIYKFIDLNRREYSVQTMCKVLDVAPSGYYECSSGRYPLAR